MRDYSLGLHQVSDACHAYLQPDGGWGWSNAGLVVGDGASLLVDTLFDLRLTAEMLAAMAPVTAVSPIGTAVNTHANGDHCYGNALLGAPGGDVEIIASAAAAHEMTEIPPSMLAALNAADGDVGALFRRFFGAFDFEGIDLRLPDRTFDDRLTVEVGGRTIELHEVGPAHTAGDVLVHVPGDRVAFTGDILFIGGTPIVWAGPLSNWIAACDLITSWDVDVVVPGHGPVTDKAGVCAVRDELVFIDVAARERFDAGMPAAAAAADILRESGGHGLAEQGRIAVNVETAYRAFAAERGETHTSANVVALFSLMAELEGWQP
jgi:cyclase